MGSVMPPKFAFPGRTTDLVGEKSHNSSIAGRRMLCAHLLSSALNDSFVASFIFMIMQATVARRLSDWKLAHPSPTAADKKTLQVVFSIRRKVLAPQR